MTDEQVQEIIRLLEQISKQLEHIEMCQEAISNR